MIRSFLAILLTEPVRQSVATEIDRLRPLSRAVAWVPAQNLHLTLQFLGQQSEARLAEAHGAVEEVAARTAPLSLSLYGIGAFPGIERPRILWVGVTEGALEVRALQSRVAGALVARGFPGESRPWHPHLTIGRVFDERRWRRDAGPELRAALVRAAGSSFGTLPVGTIALMRSDLSAAGARYSVLQSVALTAS